MAGSAFGEFQGEVATTDERQRQRAAEREQYFRQMAQNLRNRATALERDFRMNPLAGRAEVTQMNFLRSRADALDERANEIQRKGSLYQPGLAQPRPRAPRVSDRDVSICQQAVGNYAPLENSKDLLTDLADAHAEILRAGRLRLNLPKPPLGSMCAKQRAYDQYARALADIAFMGRDLDLVTQFVPRNDVDRIESKLEQLEVDIRGTPEGELPTATRVAEELEMAKGIDDMLRLAVSRGIANCIAARMGGG